MNAIATDIADDPLYSAKRVCLELGGLALITLRRRRKAGLLPPPVVIDGRNYWRRSVIEHLKEQGDGSTCRLPGETKASHAT